MLGSMRVVTFKCSGKLRDKINRASKAGKIKRAGKGIYIGA
jgi:hypothetical protein